MLIKFAREGTVPILFYLSFDIEEETNIDIYFFRLFVVHGGMSH